MPPRPLPQDKFDDIIRTLIRLATNVQDMQPAIQAFLAQNTDIEQELAEDGTSVHSLTTEFDSALEQVHALQHFAVAPGSVRTLEKLANTLYSVKASLLEVFWFCYPADNEAREEQGVLDVDARWVTVLQAIRKLATVFGSEQGS